MAGKKILVVGDVMLDTYRYGEVSRISPEAPVPVFLETGRVGHAPGGAANVAANIAAAGVPVDLCAVVGDDEAAEVLRGLLEEQHVDTRLLRVDGGRRTTRKLRYIGQDGRQILRADTEDAGDVPWEAVRGGPDGAAGLEGYGLVLLSDYGKGVVTEEAAQALIRLADGRRVPVLADVKGRDFRKYRGATLLKPNRRELAELTGMRAGTEAEAAAAAERLCREASCRYVLATLGADGMLLVERGAAARRVRSTAREVYDVTGAGDTAIAYLAAGLALGKGMAEAVEAANYAAGLQVERAGTGVVRPEEVAGAMGVRAGGGKGLDLRRLRELRRAGRRVVFTNGCFDVLHAGHAAYLAEARRLGDVLVVGVNGDASVRRLKGEGRPVNTLEDRLLLLSALECVDYVAPFDEDTPLELIRRIEPDVLAKGGDYRADEVVGAREAAAWGGEVRILPFVDGRSTTGMIERIKRGRGGDE